MGRSLSTAALYGLVDEVAECLGEPVDSLAHVRRVRLLQDALVGRIKLLVISLMSTRITRRDLPRSPRVQGRFAQRTGLSVCNRCDLRIRLLRSEREPRFNVAVDAQYLLLCRTVRRRTRFERRTRCRS